MGNRSKIVAEIERALARVENRPGSCLYYAHHTARILWQRRYRIVIQAGSLQWPRVRRDEDDGKIDTHFSFMFSPHTPESKLSMALGNLPELHAWVGILSTQELVDFSTRHLVAAALERGMTWTAAKPPKFLWCQEPPDWVVYHPDRDASIYACTILKKLFDPAYLRR